MANANDSTSITDAIRPERLRRWVIVLGVFAILANVGTDAYNQWRSYHVTVTNTGRELVNAARILAAQAQGTVQIVDVLLRDVAAGGFLDVGSMPPSGDINARLAGRVQGLPQLLALTVSDAQGIERYRSRPFPNDPYPSIADRSFFTVQRDTPNVGLFLSEPVVTRLDHRWAIALSRRLNDSSGRFAGIVSGMIDLDYFQQFYRQLKLGNQSAILLFRDDGTLTVREPPDPDMIGKVMFPDLVARIGSEGGATRMPSPVDGVERFVAGAHVDGFPLIVAVSREERAVLESWRAEVFRVLVQDVILTALMALAIAALVHQLRRVERGEQALRESEERYALAMEGANEGHFDRPFPDGKPFMSPRMLELLGLAPDAPVDTRAQMLVNVHPDDLHRMDAAYEAHIQGRTNRYEIEYRVRHPDGEWHWLDVRGRCLRDASGTVHRFVGSAMDITERKRAEEDKDRRETQLRKSQKMEAMGTLAGGIAHDFNNILGAILGYGELAQKDAPEGSGIRRYVDNVMHAGGRAKALVERILAFSRSGMGERGPINVQAVIEETLELLAASLPPGVRLEKRLEAGDAAVDGDETQLHQVAMNLC